MSLSRREFLRNARRHRRRRRRGRPDRRPVLARRAICRRRRSRLRRARGARRRRARTRAKQLGATYADIRINRYRNRSVSLRTSPERGGTGKVNHVPGRDRERDLRLRRAGDPLRRLGLRRQSRGSRRTRSRGSTARRGRRSRKANAALQQQAGRSSRRCRRIATRYITPLTKDPFDVPIAGPAGVPAGGPRGGEEGAGRADRATPRSSFRTEDKYFASTEGSSIQQLILQTAPSFTATAVDFATRKSKSRSFQVAPGHRRLRARRARAACSSSAERVGDEAVEHLKAPSVEPGVKDLVLLPDAPRAHDPRVHRPLDRARSRARLRGQLRRHVVPGAARQAGQVPRRLDDRQRHRRPHAAARRCPPCGYDDDGVKTTQFARSSRTACSSATRRSATRRTWSARRSRAAAATPTASTRSRSSACPTSGSSPARDGTSRSTT